MTMLVRLWLISALLAVAGVASAQPDPLAATTAQLAQAEADLRAVDRAFDERVEADERPILRAKAVTAQQTARTAAARLHEQIELVDARITGFGPATAGTVEAPEIRRQRARLVQERTALDAAIKRASLAEVEARQLVDEIARSQAEQLTETLSTRVASPLTPSFWRPVLQSFPRDLRRIDLFLREGAGELIREGRGGFPWPLLLGLALALVFAFPVRLLGRTFGQRYLIGNTPSSRLRRSGFAIWRVLVGTIALLMAAVAVEQGLRWAGIWPERWSSLLDGLVMATGFGAFAAALGGAVLMPRQPSWRLAPISDETAVRLRPFVSALSGLVFASILTDAFNQAVGASRPALLTTQAMEALLHLSLTAAFLLALGRLRAERIDTEDSDSQSASAGVGIVTLVTWLFVGVAFVSLLTGYIGFSIFVARLVAWLLIVGSALYILMLAADDVAIGLFNRESRVGLVIVRGFGLRGSLLDQFGLLLSAALKIILLLIAIGLVLSPFGAGGIDGLFGRLGTFAQGIEIGGIAISPGAILRSIVVLMLGLALVRAFNSWLERRYLPATDLDGSAQNSVSLIARYVGIALAFIWGLASLGIGLERVALLLSALSVGIGFGLQAITQNFVSGVILLAERPIKIGDWIRVGTDEGDVKRINVRSTEIALADHSTLIVPNSELITKSVLNKTLGKALGRIQIQFSVRLGTDVALVRDIVLHAFSSEPEVLDGPERAVFVDSISEGRILFNCFAHVSSPRAAYAARSNVLMVLLNRFRDEGIDIGTVPPTP